MRQQVKEKQARRKTWRPQETAQARKRKEKKEVTGE